MSKDFYERMMVAQQNQQIPKLKHLLWPAAEGLVGKQSDLLILDDIGGSAMNKFAPVVPFHFYQQFLLHGYIPSSVLLLAHDVVAHADEYTELFQDPRWNSTTIFMDNSLVELKQAVDIEMVDAAVKIVGRVSNPVVVICPDVMAEAQASAKLTKDSWPEWAWRFRDNPKLVVIQGSTMDGFLECAEELAELNPEWVSIPRVTESLFGYHRRELIPYVKALFPNSKIHLLGFSDYIWEDLRAAAHPDVLSIDSAVPFRMSTTNIFSEVVPSRGDWWETASFDKSCLDRVDRINDLIDGLI